MNSFRPSWIALAVKAVVASILFCTAAGAQEPVKIAVTGQPFVANLYLPRAEGRFPAILLFGGSGGGIGWQDYMGDVLARRGFAVLALAYFGMDGLPKSLERIPLEYFEGALKYLRSHRAVDPRAMGALGVPKGRSCVPRCFSTPGHPRHSSFCSEWSDFPKRRAGFSANVFVDEEGQGSALLSPTPRTDPSDRSVADMYRRSLRQDRELQAATIPVEKVRGAILMLSGKEDTLWPSTELAEMVVQRLRKHNFRLPYEHIAYDDAGHLISSIRPNATGRGGTESGVRFAQEDGQRRVIAFFSQHLGEKARHGN